MKTQMNKKQDILLERMRKHDEELLKLLKQGHRELITKVIITFLSSNE
jgi:hypothetical protein